LNIPYTAYSDITVLRPGVAAFLSSDTGDRTELLFTDGVSSSSTNIFATISSQRFSTTIKISKDVTPQGDGSAAFTITTSGFNLLRGSFSDESTSSTSQYKPAASTERYGAWFQTFSYGAYGPNTGFASDVAGSLAPTHDRNGEPSNTVAVGDIAGWARLDGNRAILSHRPNDPQTPGGLVDNRGIELWLVTGSALTLLADINPAGASIPLALANIGGGRVAFNADAGNGLGRELWITDGTVAGTKAVGDLRPGAAGSEPTGFTATTGGRFVFSADDGVAGRELWVSDGTTAGTRLLVDLLPGAAGSDPQNFTALADGRVAFTATGATGAGLWVTDGTAAGTVAFGAGLAASNLAATTLFDGVNRTATPDFFFGTYFPALIVGSARDDALRGTVLGDTIYWSAGDDVLDGGAGTDTASYRGFNERAWTTSYKPVDGLKLSRAGETDTLISIEKLSFIDGDLTFDAESATAVVTRLYQLALGRAPDPQALNQGSTQLQLGINTANAPVKAGLTMSQLAANIIASDGFQAVHGASQTDAGFVSDLYTIGLGRAAEDSGLSFWTNVLATGGSRADVLTGFSQSAEMRTKTAGALSTGLWDVDETSAQVARLYLAALDRTPDLPGFIANRDFITPAPPAGQPLLGTLKGVAAGMLASPEFNRIPAGDDSAFVTRLYAQALDRAPEPTGLAFWTAQLKAGLSRADVLLGFSESAEHQLISAPYVMPADGHGIVFA
jgi:ELWxxDGT repeat protein